jgi:ABC-type glycerol-3-phosphate transport system substrate-binding protein
MFNTDNISRRKFLTVISYIFLNNVLSNKNSTSLSFNATPDKKKLSIYLQAFTPREQLRSDRWPPPTYIWKIFEDYKKINPSVEFDYIKSQMPANDFEPWIRTLLVGNRAPDIFWIQHENANSIYGPSGLLIDLNPYLEKPNKYVKDNKHWKDIFFDVAYNKSQAHNGEHFVIDGDIVTTGFYYNKDIFGKLGIEIPKTWAEFIFVSKELKKAGYPMIMPAKEENQMAWTHFAIYWQLLYDIYPALDILDPKGYITSKECVIAIKRGVIKTQNDNFREGYRLIKEWAQTWCDCSLGLNSNQAYQQFLTGKGSMYWEGSWYIKPMLYDKLLNFEWGIFNFPKITRESSSLVNPNLKVGLIGGATGGFQFAVPKSVINKGLLDDVVDFLQYLSAPQNIGPLLSDLGFTVPAVYGAEFPEKLKPLFNSIMPGEDQIFFQSYITDSSFTQMTPECTTKSIRILQEYIANKYSLDESLTRLQNLIDYICDKLIEINNWDLKEYL